MKAAKAAFKPWARLTPGARQLALLKLADAIEANADALVEAQHRNTGQPRDTIRTDEVEAGADQLRFFAGAARLLEGKCAGEYIEGTTSYVRREPIGVVGQVTPWNYPFLMAIWKIGPALATGNTIVLKPSDTTPESTLELARLSQGILPDGVLNIVLGNGATGAAIVDHPTPGPGLDHRIRARGNGRRLRGREEPQARPPRARRQGAGRGLRRRRRREDRRRRSPTSRSTTPARTARPSPACSCTSRSTTNSSRHWCSRPRAARPAAPTTARTTSAR